MHLHNDDDDDYEDTKDDAGVDDNDDDDCKEPVGAWRDCAGPRFSLRQ